MMQITVDGKEIPVNDEETILEAATRGGIRIPTLCYHKKLLPIGSCRVCMVEIEGADESVASCTTAVSDGLVVRTQTERLRAMRSTAIRLMLLDHRLDCHICEKSGDCVLQDLAYEYGVSAHDFGEISVIKDVGSYATPLITYHPDRCVMCGRCIHACKEIKGLEALSIYEKGSSAHVGSDPDRCISCGECLHVCPVGALTQNLTRPPFRQHKMEKVQTTCPYCGVGCQLELNVADGRVWDVTTNDEVGVDHGSLCVKGRFGFDFIHHPDRLTQPLIRQNGQFKETTWDDAWNLAARRLKEIRSSHGADSIIGFSSARCTNEENYLFQKFMRTALGTNNVDHCARL
jgi:predicted molibdopterin-dependent oxidoreductase YjgC